MSNKEPGFIGKLRKLNACDEGIEFASKYKSLQAAYDNCEDAGRLLWLLFRSQKYVIGGNRHKKLVSITNAVARTALKFAGKLRAVTKKCLDTTDAWCRGKASTEEVKKAADVAFVAADSVYIAVDSAYKKHQRLCARLIRKLHPSAPRITAV